MQMHGIWRGGMALMLIGACPVCAGAMEIAPQAQYFIPQPGTAPVSDDLFPTSPQPTRDEFTPSPAVAPQAALAPYAETAPVANEIYPAADMIASADIVPSATIAPEANRFLPQAESAPMAAEFLP